MFKKNRDDDKRFNDDEFNRDYDKKNNDNKRDNADLLMKAFLLIIGLSLVVFVSFRVFGVGEQVFTNVDSGIQDDIVAEVEEDIIIDDDDSSKEKKPFSFLDKYSKEDEDEEIEEFEEGEWLDEDEWLEEDDQDTLSLKDVINKEEEKVYDGITKVHFIDVGQGDAAMIQSPDGKVSLIDGGPRSSSSKLVEYLKLNGVSHIDTVIATHPHEDHIGGLADVLDEFMVDKIIMPDVAHSTKTFENLLNAIDRNDVKLLMAEETSSVYNVGDFKNTILYPPSKSQRDKVFKDTKNLNLYSVVNKIEHGDVSFMFTGDAEVPIENYLFFNKEKYLSSTVLKVGHHGSTTSTSDLFLKTVNPKVAIISSGSNNKYGHPHEEIVNKLEEAGVSIYDTKVHGDIVITSNGHKIDVKTSK